VHDLVIVGCGPVGAVAANLAGQAGLSAVVIERADNVFDLPRAIHFDAHIMRILQQAGVASDVLADTRVWKRSTFYGADGKPIRVHDWADDRTYGWDAHYLFYQPALERVLRTRLEQLGGIELRLGTEAIDIVQHDEHVTVTTRNVATGGTDELTARFVVACDGASSFLRAHSKIALIDSDFDEPWLVIDLLTERELGRPNESEMFCDPNRPATRVPGPGTHNRWEFMLLPGETAAQMQRPESIEALLRPWVRMDEVEILRASVYRFHALVAERWRDGRLFLAGDAAHQTPPFLGQGLCHGIRDVQNLLWKIAAVLRGAPMNRLLDSYEAERRPHVVRIIDMAVAAGRDICVLDPAAAAERDARIRRAAASGVLAPTTFQGMPSLRGGLFDSDTAGELFPQPLVRTSTGLELMMDDAIGSDIAVVAVPEALIRWSDITDDPSVPVVATGTGAGIELVTVSAETAKWLAERDATMAILRPDRYVHALARDDDVGALALRELCALIPRG
jgi:3-(3-hydroxy-phenyl)propionate hydroxylase